MSNKYSQSKIYEIVCNKTGKRYIGSSCEDLLSQRLANHRSNFKRFKNKKLQGYTTSFSVLEGGDYYINLLEKVNATCKDELLARERHYINTMTCVNKFRPLRKNKEYYKDNIVVITAKKSVKNDCECSGKYRTDNKVHHLKTNKHINYIIEKDLKDKSILVDLSFKGESPTFPLGINGMHQMHNGASNYAIHIGEPILDLAHNILHICPCCKNVF
jgi:hypothetical protein